MKKTMKKLAGTILTAALVLSTGISSFAFYQETTTKKGLLVNSSMFDDFLELGCQHMEVNLSTYQSPDGFLWLTEKCRDNGICFTMILINSSNGQDVHSMLPVDHLVDGVSTYAFNTLTPEGTAQVRDYARTVANIYKDSVSNWIIGNEVSLGGHFDYSGVADIDEHAEDYATAFRIFYEEIKAANPDARLYIPFDYGWNTPFNPASPMTYATKEYLPKLNALLKDTEYGVAWHPYPTDMFVGPEFMADAFATNDENAYVINMKNLDVLTNFLQKPEMLAPDGSMRRVLLSEEGFTSACENGEERQAAAIQQAYEIANANPYVDAFILSRQVDAGSQEAFGGAFGLWKRDPNAERDETPLAKKKSWYVYRDLK